jgi:hypothetical protein
MPVDTKEARCRLRQQLGFSLNAERVQVFISTLQVRLHVVALKTSAM